MKHLDFFKRCLILFLVFIFSDFLISIVLINGLNKFYGFSKKPEILFNGSSMTMSGFNRKDIESITGKQIATYAQEGVSVIDRNAMIIHFFQMYPDGVKTVVYEVNPLLFSQVRTAKNVYTNFYPYMDDKIIDRYIKENAVTEEYYTNKFIRTKRFESRLIRLILMGYLGKYDNLKTNTLDTASLLPLKKQKVKTEVIMDQSSIDVFERTMELISTHNSNIVLVMMPMYYIKLQSFSSNGYGNLIRYLNDYSSVKKNIKFLNLNQDSIVYNPGYFSDQLHFNVYGQNKITNIISSYLIER